MEVGKDKILVDSITFNELVQIQACYESLSKKGYCCSEYIDSDPEKEMVMRVYQCNKIDVEESIKRIASADLKKSRMQYEEKLNNVYKRNLWERIINKRV